MTAGNGPSPVGVASHACSGSPSSPGKVTERHEGVADLVVVGSGFAGSILARVARVLGLRVVLLERGEATAAAALFEQVLADQPEATRVHYSLGMAYRAQGEVETLGPTGMPVGVLAGAPYKTGECSLGPGDLITLYSDGIPETQKIDDEDEYGEDRFEQLLVRERAGDLGELFGKLKTELEEYRGDAPVGDDVTLVIVRRDPAA